MKISKNDRPALILIVIQKAFDDINYWGGSRNNPDGKFYINTALRINNKDGW
jgi:hypothetical protein